MLQNRLAFWHQNNCKRRKNMNKTLEKMAEYCEKNSNSVYRIAVMEGENEPEVITLREMNACMNSYSVAKAFTVTAIGFLVDDGCLSVDEKLTDILAGEYEKTDIVDERWYKVTVDMALRHGIGLPGGFLDIDSVDPLSFGDDYLSYTLKQPLDYEPGTERVYTDAAYYLLARVAERRAGMSLDIFLWKRLFTPLSFREVAWSRCPKGHVMGATGLYIYTADMVKLGALYLHGGKWRGERLLSENWVNTVLERRYELKLTDYGDSYGKGGMNGQMLLVVPEKNRVVAWHSYGENPKELMQIAAFA